MNAWNETHYARAREFLRLVAEAVGPPAYPATDMPPPAMVRAPLPPAPPPAAPAAPPAGPAPVVAPAPAPTPGPSAASVFKKIPWGKK